MNNKTPDFTILMYITYYPDTMGRNTGKERHLYKYYSSGYGGMVLPDKRDMKSLNEKFAGYCPVMPGLVACDTDGVPIGVEPDMSGDRYAHYLLAEYAAHYGKYCEWLNTYSFEVVVKRRESTVQIVEDPCQRN